jgi:hypothetical protein
MFPADLTTKAVVLAAVFGCGAAAGFGLRGNIANATEAALKEDFARYKERQVSAALEAERKLAAENADLARKIETLDQKHFQELTHAQKRISDLLAGIRSRDVRLSVPVKRSGAETVPGSTGCTGLDHGTERAELDGETAESLVRIAADGDRAAGKLTACQEYVRRVTGAGF